MTSAANRKDIRALEKESKLAELNDRQVVSGVMSTLIGRKWMWEKLEGCHIFAQSFTLDPLLTAFNEGERKQGLLLLNAILQACPDQYLTAAREANDRRTAAELTRSPNSDGGDSGSVDSTDDPDADTGPADPGTFAADIYAER